MWLMNLNGRLAKNSFLEYSIQQQLNFPLRQQFINALLLPTHSNSVDSLCKCHHSLSTQAHEWLLHFSWILWVLKVAPCQLLQSSTSRYDTDSCLFCLSPWKKILHAFSVYCAVPNIYIWILWKENIRLLCISAHKIPCLAVKTLQVHLSLIVHHMLGVYLIKQ